MIDLRKKITSVFGLHESGKTYLAKYLAEQYYSAVFDPLGEWPTDNKRIDVYRPDSNNYPGIAKELDSFLSHVREQKKWDMVFVEEASSPLPNKKSPEPVFSNFLNYYRHPFSERGWNCGAVFICRRPTRLYTSIPELSHYLFLFKLPGKNDRRYLDDIALGLSDENEKLGKYEFTLVEPDRNYSSLGPI